MSMDDIRNFWGEPPQSPPPPRQQATCNCETCILLREYGRVRQWGVLEKGDGSERCAQCGIRDPRDSFYVWLPGPVPVCGRQCAREVEERRFKQRGQPWSF